MTDPQVGEGAAMNVPVEVRRNISPYDLSSADNPGAIISLPLLNGMNYDERAIGMKMALISREKFGFIDGTILKPVEGSADSEDWITIQALLVSWIKMSIDLALRSTISHRDVAKDLWDHLKKRFSVMNGARVQQLKVELAGCRQQGQSVESYYGKLNRIWDNLAAHLPLRTCKCGNCTCDLGTAQEKDREEDQVHQFLFGLEEQFRSVRSSLVARVPIQPLEEVYNIVRQEEDLRGNDIEKEVQSTFAVQSKNQYPGDEKKIICGHCNKPGHLPENCFLVIGYPEWWGDRAKGRSVQGRGRGIGGANYTGKGRRQSNYAHHVTVLGSDKGREHVNHVITDKDRDGVSVISEQQWNAIKSILNGGTSSASKSNTETMTGKIDSLSTWIMDTGASHHITGTFNLLADVHDMDPVLIIMADGRERVSTKEGKVRLGANLVLKSVYYIEGLPTDLISMAQLLDANGCVVQLSDEFLLVQDHISRMLIGVGKRVGGTYHFRSIELAAVVSDEATLYTIGWICFLLIHLPSMCYSRHPTFLTFDLI